MVQFMVEEIEDLLLAALEELRERPTVVAALIAAVVGGVVGSWIAERRRPEPAPVKTVTGQLAELLAPIALAIGRARLVGMAGSVGQQAGSGARRVGEKASEPAEGVGNAAALLPIVLRLAQSPIVRAIVFTIIARRLRAR
ncbi:MAG: hypothetical protein JO023_09150 [Chloroflexi bacterium]|nr:hypothetical protein [Chloroflexota bacterium]